MNFCPLPPTRGCSSPLERRLSVPLLPFSVILYWEVDGAVNLLHDVSLTLLPSELLSVAYYVTLDPVYLSGPLPLLGNAGPAHTVCEPYFTQVLVVHQKERVLNRKHSL